MKKRIHVDQHAIRHNAKEGTEKRPPISVKTYQNNHKTFAVEIEGPSELVYRPDHPLSCGAKLWIETDADVVLDNGERVC